MTRGEATRGSKIADFERTLFMNGPFGHENCLHTKPALGKKNLEYKCLPIFCLLTLLGYAHVCLHDLMIVQKAQCNGLK